MAEKTNHNLPAMDDYINRVYKLILLLVPVRASAQACATPLPRS